MAALDSTHDRLFGGALSLRQPARQTGYRVNVDALLLASFAVPAHPAKLAVDLGSGVGAVGLTLLHLGGATRLMMVEIDARLADLARLNASENGWGDRIEVVHGDVAAARAQADLVVCNPPYVVPGRGRAPNERVRTAKYGDLTAFARAARRVTGRRARACFVYPAGEATTLLDELRRSGLEPKRLRAVHGRSGERARIVLVECAPGGKPGGLFIEAPLFETDGRGARTPELKAILGAKRAP